MAIHEARQEYIVDILIKGMEEDSVAEEEKLEEELMTKRSAPRHVNKLDFDWYVRASRTGAELKMAYICGHVP